MKLCTLLCVLYRLEPGQKLILLLSVPFEEILEPIRSKTAVFVVVGDDSVQQ